MYTKYCVVLLFVFTSVLKSQSFEGGLLGGVAGSQIDGDSHGFYNKPGLIAGAFVRYPLSKNIFWQIEFKYIGKGAASNNMLNSDSTNVSDTPKPLYRVNLHYAEMPMLLIYKYNKNFSFEGGLGLGYMISASANDALGDAVENTANYNSVDYTYILGLSYHWTPRLSLNFRYCYSIIPISDQLLGNHFFLNQMGLFNNSLTATIFYRLDGNVKK